MTDRDTTTKKYYVYAHCFETEIFYIGKGCGERAGVRKERNTIWENYVSLIDGDYQVLIIKRFSRESDALKFEKQLIEKHKPCCNIAMNANNNQRSNAMRVIDLTRLAKKSGRDLNLTWHHEVGRWAIYYGKYNTGRAWITSFSSSKISAQAVTLLSDEQMANFEGIDISQLRRCDDIKVGLRNYTE